MKDRSADPFGRTDKLDDSVLTALVTRFEARGKNPRFARMLGDYLDAMSIDRSARVLDMGCGGPGLRREPSPDGQALPGISPASISAPTSWRQRSSWPVSLSSPANCNLWPAMLERSVLRMGHSTR